MIIQIRGTGGSGKSTVVRRTMELYPNKTANHVTNRSRPISYNLWKDNGDSRYLLFVPGHYETPTGGCDTIKTPDEVFTLVTDAADNGMDVLFEGIMIGDDVRRMVETSRKYPSLVIALNTPLPECLAGIQSRRDIRGDDRPLNPKNTESRANRLRTSMIPRLKDAGVECKWMNREEAFEEVKRRFGL